MGGKNVRTESPNCRKRTSGCHYKGYTPSLQGSGDVSGDLSVADTVPRVTAPQYKQYQASREMAALCYKTHYKKSTHSVSNPYGARRNPMRDNSVYYLGAVFLLMLRSSIKFKRA